MKINKKNKICVLGLGYIGLPTALLFAKSGYNVFGFDIDKEKINKLKNKKLPFEEPGLFDLFQKSYANISFNLKPQPADVFIISVPTPITDSRDVNLEYLKKAGKSISKIIQEKNLVIVESTVPPGTIEKVIKPIIQENKKIDIFLAHAPERAIPGQTLKEMIENHRIIGGINSESAKLTKNLYSSFVKGTIHTTNTTTAEAVKILENTYRDINIGFANEIAKLSEQIGINAWEATELANLHPRVNFHKPGPGVGGHCIPIDPWFFIRKDGVGNDMIKLARKINDTMPQYVIKSIEKLVEDIQNPTITILGAAYKENVDDWRESPTLKIIKLAEEKNWHIKIHDPFVKNFPYQIKSKLQEATKNSDCLLLATCHQEYKNLDPKTIKNMSHKNIYDARNCINSQKWQKENFKVTILGQKNNVYKLT